MSGIDNTVQLIGRQGAGSRLTAAVDYLNAPVVIYERPQIIEKLAFVRSLPDSRPTAVIWLVYKTKRRVRGHLHRPRHTAPLHWYCGAARILRPQPSVAQGLPHAHCSRKNEWISHRASSTLDLVLRLSRLDPSSVIKLLNIETNYTRNQR